MIINVNKKEDMEGYECLSPDKTSHIKEDLNLIYLEFRNFVLITQESIICLLATIF